MGRGALLVWPDRYSREQCRYIHGASAIDDVDGLVARNMEDNVGGQPARAGPPQPSRRPIDGRSRRWTHGQHFLTRGVPRRAGRTGLRREQGRTERAQPITREGARAAQSNRALHRARLGRNRNGRPTSSWRKRAGTPRPASAGPGGHDGGGRPHRCLLCNGRTRSHDRSRVGSERRELPPHLSEQRRDRLNPAPQRTGTDTTPVVRVQAGVASRNRLHKSSEMRRNRIKIDPSDGEACYHCVTRTVNGERLFQQADQEVLRRMIWRVADYCGLQVITYTILSNHFHVLVRVPAQAPVADEELLRRYAVLFSTPGNFEPARFSTVKKMLIENGPEAERWRRRHLALMGDISQYMKILKQRFSIRYNQAHGRFGTLWAERFKSILVENVEHVLATVAAYIDLNGVRAGLAADPKDYRFCGYAEAVAGCKAPREGLQSIFNSADWCAVQASYRLRIFASGSAPREGKSAISAADFAEALRTGGKLPLATVLRCRVKYFSHGGALGGMAFLKETLAARRKKTGETVGYPASPLPPITDWGELSTLMPIKDAGLH
ncbi:MAG: hypothetical protein RIR76_2500 [Verrucomicrobiota bacterium]